MGKAASESQTKQNYSQLKPALDTIHGYAEQNGLQAQILRRIINAITQPNSLDLSTQKHLIKSLYPKDKVPSELIIITVGSLGHGILKASVWTQQLLLEWVTMVYDHLEEPSILSSLYSILFNLLDMTTLRAGLCHLLTIITRKKHVRPFRIQMLRDLEQSVGREPALMKLMQIFEEYAPGSLNVGKGTRRVPAFSHPDSDWGERLQRIQERAESENMGSALSSDLSRSLRKEVERGRLETLTERSNSLGEIDSLENLVTKFEDIRVSDLTIADLESPIVQQYLLLQPQEASVEGIDRCLSPLFEHLETLTSGQDISTLVSEILEKLLTYTRYSKTLPNSAITFFKTYLPRWQGQRDQEIILSLLLYLPLRSFIGKSSNSNPSTSLMKSDAYATILQPLEIALLAFTDTTTTTQLTLLIFYNSLLANWTTHLLSGSTVPTLSHSVSIIALANHVALLCLTILTTSPTQTTISTILTYYESLPPLLHPPLSVSIPPPQPLAVYLLLFANPSLSTLSRLSSILANFKTAFELPPAAADNRDPAGLAIPQAKSSDQIKSLNAALIDTCNLFFRSRAFNGGDTHSLGCLIPTSVVGPLSSYTSALDPPQPLTGLFSLSHHPMLAALNIAAFREMEDAADEADPGVVSVRHAGPITQKSLAQLGRDGGVKVSWKEYRIAVLNWLEEVGAEGVGELGRATLPGLVKKNADVVAKNE
ncbi:hypothetical protein MMC28_006482 [Mycoblastus sanguinarius]|nr:hypothetical protein [Mycoblastus sanguinarius]